MTHDDLVEYAHEYLIQTLGCKFAFRDLHAQTTERPDALGFYSIYKTILIECKVSRSDFHADQQKPHRQNGRGMGNFRFYMAPRGLLDSDEMPSGWGLIRAVQGEDGLKGRRVHGPSGPPSKWGRPEWYHEPQRKWERKMMFKALRRTHLRGNMEDIYDTPWKS